MYLPLFFSGIHKQGQISWLERKRGWKPEYGYPESVRRTGYGSLVFYDPTTEKRYKKPTTTKTTAATTTNNNKQQYIHTVYTLFANRRRVSSRRKHRKTRRECMYYVYVARPVLNCTLLQRKSSCINTRLDDYARSFVFSFVWSIFFYRWLLILSLSASSMNFY